MSEVRHDSAIELEAPTQMPDGSMVYHARVARTGVHHYPWGIERRDADELGRIIPQLPNIPVTVFHPTKLLHMGGQARIVGKILDARVDGDHAYAKLRITPEGVMHVRAGIKELSLGYRTNAVNGRQTETRIDHVALVTNSRCGPSCSLRADCQGACGQGYSLPLQVANQLGAMRLLRKG